MIDVIVCTLKDHDLFMGCMECLERQRNLGKIVVVTSKWDRETIGIAECFKQTEVVFEPDNSCLAWARKLGVNATTNKSVAYVDSDVFLGKDHLVFLELVVKPLRKRKKHTVVEGILIPRIEKPSISFIPSIYETEVIPKGGRGFTHNTLFNRETLLSWKPRFTYAWEDWLLTQHVQSLGGNWIRCRTHTNSFHIVDGSVIRQYQWDAAGERLVKNNQKKLKMTLKIARYLARGVKSSVVLKNPRYLLRNWLRAIGTTMGYFNYPKYMKLRDATPKGMQHNDFEKLFDK